MSGFTYDIGSVVSFVAVDGWHAERDVLQDTGSMIVKVGVDTANVVGWAVVVTGKEGWSVATGVVPVLVFRGETLVGDDGWRLVKSEGLRGSFQRR